MATIGQPRYQRQGPYFVLEPLLSRVGGASLQPHELPRQKAKNCLCPCLSRSPSKVRLCQCTSPYFSIFSHLLHGRTRLHLLGLTYENTIVRLLHMVVLATCRLCPCRCILACDSTRYLTGILGAIAAPPPPPLASFTPESPRADAQ